jgi:hypothetical protein
LRKAIEAFREGRRFCEERTTGTDKPDRLLVSLAYNERYLCRVHRALASQLKDPAERAANAKQSLARVYHVHFDNKAIRLRWPRSKSRRRHDLCRTAAGSDTSRGLFLRMT